MASFELKSIVFCLIATAAYFLVSLQYGGPAYLADEIGYLNNAAFIAGHHSDGASSYYAGFSLLVSPLFYFFSDSQDVWMGILATNSFMWGATLFLVSLLLRKLQSGAAEWKIILALFVVAMYPAYLAMSGYAFSQTAFAFVFTSAAYSLSYLDSRRSISVLPHALLVGYLCCVHPVGLSVAVASSVAIFVTFWRSRRFLLPAVNAGVIVAVAGAYLGLIRPWMIGEMTPIGGMASLHYQDASLVLRDGISLEQLKMSVGVVAGQAAYLFVATFGFIVAGAAWFVRDAWHSWGALKIDVPEKAPIFRFAIAVFLVLAVVGIIFETRLATLLVRPDRFDHWIYGRYVEPVIALLFGMGLLSRVSRTAVFISALFVVLTGAWLVHVVDATGPLYVMNVPGWWPEFTRLGSSHLSWFVVGAGGIVVASLFHRVMASILILVSFAYCANAQRAWHQNILTHISNPSNIPAFIEENYGSGVCVGFDYLSASLPGLPELARERANMYSFYLFNSPMIRMSPQRWLESCPGPLLTFNGDLDIPGIEYIGRETSSNLYVVAREEERKFLFPDEESGEQYWKDSQSESCLLAGCFHVEGARLHAFHEIGKPSEAGIRTDGRAGYLIYGPYAPLPRGDYILELKGDFGAVDGAKVDIVNGSSTVYAVSALSELLSSDRKKAHLPFSIPDHAQRLEIRILVSEKDDIQLNGYGIDHMAGFANESKPGTGDEPITRFRYGAADLARLPRQIGTMGRSGLRSDGRQGFMFYGPYRKLLAGRYVLQVTGKSDAAAGSWVDVVSGNGERTYLRVPVPAQAGEGSLIHAEFTVDREVPDLEVRAFAGSGDRIVVNEYSVNPVQPSN
ncbi:hypothetical protein [Pseudoxanthomonas sp. UTMC 1351]|uniref:hypothetical protein n=1 Tax=Pseudoxanthomonas sp. UTMC 1351 TaxID=2695853 RepID=UPI0034CFF4AB